jgi:hypothetical protein
LIFWFDGLGEVGRRELKFFEFPEFHGMLRLSCGLVSAQCPSRFLAIGRSVLDKKKRKKKDRARGHEIKGKNYDERVARENMKQDELHSEIMGRPNMFASKANTRVREINIGGQKTKVAFKDMGHWKEYADNEEKASLAFQKLKKLPADAQAAILASMETENEPTMQALNEICELSPRELDQMDPQEMDKLFKTAGIDPALMFGPESKVKEECDKIAELLAIEFLELRNALPPASRFRFGEKGLLNQVHQIEKFLIGSYVGNGPEADLIQQKIQEVEKMPRSEWNAEIRRRKKALDLQQREDVKQLEDLKTKKRKILGPKPRLELIAPELDIPKDLSSFDD